MPDKLNKSSDTIDLYQYYVDQATGTNINPRSLLATDYLNHFNEVIMIIDMISDMIECIEDVTAWQPKSYVEHFRDSGFSDRDLAVAAYEYVPDIYKRPFETIITQLNGLILQVAGQLKEAASQGDHAEIARAARFAPELRLLAEKAGGIINGEAEGTDQEDIDAMLNN